MSTRVDDLAHRTMHEEATWEQGEEEDNLQTQQL